MNKKIYGAILLVFSFLCGQNLPVAIKLHLTLPEYCLFMISNHYYLVYGLFPATLFAINRKLKYQQDLEILRYGNRANYLQRKQWNILKELILLLTVHIFIAAGVGAVYLEKENCFQGDGNIDVYIDTLQYLDTFKEWFRTPVEAVLFYCLYMIWGFFTGASILLVLRQNVSRGQLIIVSLIFTASTVLGFKFQPTSLPWEFLCANNYFIMHHVLFQHGWGGILAFLAISAICLYAAFIYGTKRKISIPRNYFFKNRIWKMLVFSCVYFLLVFFQSGGKAEGIITFLYFLLKGYDNGSGINLVERMMYVLFFVYPLVMWNLSCARGLKGKNDTWLIRGESYNKWKIIFAKEGIGFLILYFLVFYFFQLGVRLLLGGNVWSAGSRNEAEILMWYGISGMDFYKACVLSLVARFLELLFVVGVDFFVSLKSRNTVIGFLVACSGYCVPEISGKWNLIFPWGKGSLYFWLS